jgi:hypothetical protein
VKTDRGTFHESNPGHSTVIQSLYSLSCLDSMVLGVNLILFRKLHGDLIVCEVMVDFSVN